MVPPERRGIAAQCAASVSGAVDALRRLMVDVYPPDLSGPGLAAALEDLAMPLREAGAEVRIEVGALPVMAPETTAALYRVPGRPLPAWPGTPALRPYGSNSARTGTGRAATGCRQRPRPSPSPLAPADRDGHFGLRLLTDRVHDLGGCFTVGPSPGGGTIVEAGIPAAGAD